MTPEPCSQCGDARVKFARCSCTHLDVFHTDSRCDHCTCERFLPWHDPLVVHAHIAAAVLKGRVA